MATSKGPSSVVCSGDVLPGIHTGFQDAAAKQKDWASIEKLDQLPNAAACASLVQQCGNARDLSQGKRVHSCITKHGYDRDKWVGNLLVQMYGKCGSMEDASMVFAKIHPKNVFSWTIMISAYAQNGHMQEARSTFDNMPYRDLVSWNAMITGYAQNGYAVDALVLFRRADHEGIQPNRVTFLSVLDACGTRGSLADGLAIHEDIVASGLGADIAIGTALVSMYGKCASIENAKNTFDKMPERNVVSWTAMLAAHAQNGLLQEARDILLLQMPERNVVSWNIMIAAYAQNGHTVEALGLFREMDLRGTMPDKHTCISILDACCANLEDGKKIHSSIAGSAFEYDVAVQTALVDMYGKCGCVQEAARVFLKMPARNVVSWTAMLAAYAQNGHLREALTLFRAMDLEGERPNQVTLITILDACPPREGKIIHAEIVDMGFLDAATGAAIISMYGKWGSTRAARSTFNSLPRRDVVAWNAMLAAACAYNEALELFPMMNLEGIHPDGITFVSALSACGHGGLLRDAWTCFRSIDSDYGIVPTVEHYRCMIDLLARAGQLIEAEDLMKSMPFEAEAVAWKSLLGACRLHADERRGTRVAQSALENDQGSAAPFVMLSNIYQGP